MLFQAHRGVSSEYPENTIPAFAAAARQGYQIIELDPLFTADGECVVFHDKTLNRTCRNSDGSEIADKIPLAELTFEELAAWVISSGSRLRMQLQMHKLIWGDKKGV